MHRCRGRVAPRLSPVGRRDGESSPAEGVHRAALAGVGERVLAIGLEHHRGARLLGEVIDEKLHVCARDRGPVLTPLTCPS